MPDPMQRYITCSCSKLRQAYETAGHFPALPTSRLVTAIPAGKIVSRMRVLGDLVVKYLHHGNGETSSSQKADSWSVNHGSTGGDRAVGRGNWCTSTSWLDGVTARARWVVTSWGSRAALGLAVNVLGADRRSRRRWSGRSALRLAVNVLSADWRSGCRGTLRLAVHVF